MDDECLRVRRSPDGVLDCRNAYRQSPPYIGSAAEQAYLPMLTDIT